MNQSRIEEAINDILEYVNACKPNKLNPNRVTVSKDELEDLLEHLRSCAPEEIRRYRKVISNEKEILQNAEVQAEEIRQAAREETKQMVEQSEVVRAAYQEADRITEETNAQIAQMYEEARQDAQQIQMSGYVYLSNKIEEAEQSIETTLKEFDNKSTMLLNSLRQSMELLQSNKQELDMAIQSMNDQNV